MCEKRILTSMAAYLGYPTKIISLVLVRIHPTITQLKYGRLISTDSSTIRMVCLRSIMTHNPVITDLDLKKNRFYQEISRWWTRKVVHFC